MAPTMSVRITELRDYLAGIMPVSKAANKAQLGSLYITDVMIQYLTWQARLIRQRPRMVVIWPEVMISQHYAAHAADIARLKAEFEAGADMNPALSNQVRSNVYAGNLPTKTKEMTQDEWVKKAWAGKDRMRVLVDVHHLHLGARKPDGSVERSGPLLFVGVTKNEVFFLALGDHDSFTDGSISGLMHQKLEARLAGAGPSLPGGLGVTLGGTQVKDTLSSITLVRQIEGADKALDQQGAGPGYKIRMDYDDVVILDPAGAEIRRYPGRL